MRHVFKAWKRKESFDQPLKGKRQFASYFCAEVMRSLRCAWCRINVRTHCTLPDCWYHPRVKSGCIQPQGKRETKALAYYLTHTPSPSGGPSLWQLSWHQAYVEKLRLGLKDHKMERKGIQKGCKGCIRDQRESLAEMWFSWKPFSLEKHTSDVQLTWWNPR